MAQTKKQIQELLRQASTRPRRQFGQNFMIDQNLLRILADAGQIHAGELVIEVGPGTGSLTEELLARGARVVAVEIDRDLAELLRREFAGEERFQLIEADVLSGKHALNPRVKQSIADELSHGGAVKLVSNLPYNVASPLVIEMLLAGVGLLAFTVQKEVAERLSAKAGDEAYGALSIMAQLLSRVEVLRVLPAKAFWPAPKVSSALVRMIREDRLGERVGRFSTFVQRVFSYRRKTLRKALELNEYPAQAVLSDAQVDGGARPEDVTPEEFVRLFDRAVREA